MSPGSGDESLTPEGARSTADMLARADELRQFEWDYQAAWSQFGTGQSLGTPYLNAHNPFRRAFLDRADPNDVAGDDPSDGGADTGDSSSGTAAPPETPIAPPAPPPPPPAGPDPVPPAPRPPPFGGGGLINPADPPGFDFVVIGDYGTGGSAERIYRARRGLQNRFFLENDREFKIGPNPEGYRVFDEDERVIVADLNQDGHLDLVRAVNGPLGARLETETGDGSGQFELQAQGSLLRRQVLSLAVYDFASDGEAELVMVTDVGPTLTIYARDGDRLVHDKELAMSFPAGFVMSSDVRPRDRRLYIMSQDMSQARMYSTRYYDGRPRRLSFSLDLVSTLELDGFAGEEDRDVMAFDDFGSFAVFERAAEGFVLYTAFPAENYPDLIIVGDYFRLGAKQMVIWW